MADAPALFSEARLRFHKALIESVLKISRDGVPSNADSSSRISVAISSGIASRIGNVTQGIRLPGQTSGSKFEKIVSLFIEDTFSYLNHIRPGNWSLDQIGGKNRLAIAGYSQYAHLGALHELASKNTLLAAALGNAYAIAPDLVMTRGLETDEKINESNLLVDSNVSRGADIRLTNGGYPILHASISCKWTIRSDRAQNARSEALNLMRNRKGKLPHIIVVTGEPMPSRLSSLALGTGDIDCVYHFALNELVSTIDELKYEDAAESLSIMIDGNRLKDIADLPLDLAT